MTITENISNEQERIAAFLETSYGRLAVCARQAEGMFDNDLMAIEFQLDGIRYRARYHERSSEKWFSFAPVKVPRETIIGQRDLYRTEFDKLLAFMQGIAENDQIPKDLAQHILRRVHRNKVIVDGVGSQ